MPLKDPEARRAYAKKLRDRLREQDPNYIARQQKYQAEYYQKRKAEDERFAEKRKADYKRWYDEHGKENARERKGYKPWEEYIAELEAKRKSRSEYMRDWYQRKGGARAKVAITIRKRGGATIEWYDATYEAQDGKCAICRTPAPKYTNGRLHVDHCHKRDRPRALLCSGCNHGIGAFREDPVIMLNAIEYLRSVCAEEGG